MTFTKSRDARTSLFKSFGTWVKRYYFDVVNIYIAIPIFDLNYERRPENIAGVQLKRLGLR